jgi:hypothetical protein
MKTAPSSLAFIRQSFHLVFRIYKSFGGEKWKSNVLLTCMLCPGIVFAHFFVMNLVSAQLYFERYF